MLPVTGLGLMGALRKPTLLVSPSTVAAPPKSFGSDGNYEFFSHFNWKLPLINLLLQKNLDFIFRFFFVEKYCVITKINGKNYGQNIKK